MTGPADPEEFSERMVGHLDHVRGLMAEHGHAVQAVSGSQDGPGWAYTVGLSRWEHPELFAVGLPPLVAQAVLNDLAVRVKAGTPLLPGTVLHDVLRGYACTFVAVDDTTAGDWFNVGRSILPVFRVVQMVVPDPEGRFPWESGYSMDPRVQPLLGSPPDPAPTGTVPA